MFRIPAPFQQPSHAGPPIGAGSFGQSHFAPAQAHSHAFSQHRAPEAMHDSPVAPVVGRGEGLMASPMR